MRNIQFFILILSCSFYLPVSCFNNELPRENLTTAKTNAPLLHSLQREKEEGFVAGTPIKTASGYKPIELIKARDIIIGTDCKGKNYERIVRHVAMKKVSSFVRLSVGDERINAAPDQKFYCSSEKAWVAAKALTNSHVLVTDNPILSQIKSKENVEEDAQVYTLTVEGHNLFITRQNILAHNAQLAVQAAAVVGLRYICLVNPIAAILGDRIDSEYSLLKTDTLLPHLNRKLGLSPHVPSIQQEQAKSLLEERSYYIDRRRQLIDLHDQFIKIKTDLLDLAKIFNPATKEFTNTWLNLNIASFDCVNPSVEQELQLAEPRKIELRQLREATLKALEKQIEDLQVSIGIHFDILKMQYEEAHESYRLDCQQIQRTRDLLSMVETQHNIIEYYNATLAAEHSVDNLIEKVNELKLLLNYYKRSTNAEIFRNTSSIENIFYLENELRDLEKNDLLQNRFIIKDNRAIFENYLAGQGINTQHLKENINANLRNQKNKKHAEALKNAQQTKLSSQFPKPPKKDDNEDEKNKAELIQQSEKVINDIMGNAKPGRETTGKAKQFEKPGNYADALKDFESLNPSDVRDIATGKLGKLPDGRPVNVRFDSSDKRPTLEIQNPNSSCIKIRYGNKIGI